MILSHKTMVATNPPLGNSKPSNFGKPKWTVHVTFIECVNAGLGPIILVLIREY